MDGVPIPRDIPLDLPLSPLFLQVLLILLFLIHILFVNLMLGAMLMAVYYEIRGRRDPDYDTLARKVASTITVNKSVAVVLGVAPLLVINVFYTLYFYSANALTGSAWILIVPLVASAFLLTYAYSYLWDALQQRKGLHLAIGMASAGLFLIVPFLFLTNINLMLFPERWSEVRGFVSALFLPNVFPRYLHFLLASIALTGFVFAGWFGRRGYPVEQVFTRFTRVDLRRHFLAVAFGATAAQLIAGPLLLLTLPSRGIGWLLLGILTAAVAFAGVALWILWKELQSSRPTLGRPYTLVAVALTGTVLLMGTGRHVYREKAVEPHRVQVRNQTQIYAAMVTGAQMRERAGLLGTGGDAGSADEGLRVFQGNCASCHAPDKVLVGPSLREIADLYKDNPDQLIAWVKKPGKKRPDFPPMPSIQLRESRYRAVADYILTQFGTETKPQDSTPPEMPRT